MPCSLHELPPELILLVASYTHPLSLPALQNTSRALRTTLSDPLLSRQLSKQHFLRDEQHSPAVSRLRIATQSRFLSAVLTITSMFRYSPDIRITAIETVSLLHTSLLAMDRNYLSKVWRLTCALFELQAVHWPTQEHHWPSPGYEICLPGTQHSPLTLTYPLEMIGALPPPLPASIIPTRVLAVYTYSIDAHIPGLSTAADFFKKTLPKDMRLVQCLWQAVHHSTSPTVPCPPISHFICLPAWKERNNMAGNPVSSFAFLELYTDETPLHISQDLGDILWSPDPDQTYLLLFSIPGADFTSSFQELVVLTADLSPHSAIGYCCAYTRIVSVLHQCGMHGTKGLDYILTLSLRTVRIITANEDLLESQAGPQLQLLLLLDIPEDEAHLYLLIRARCHRNHPWGRGSGRAAHQDSDAWPPGTAVPSAFV
ncbi:hypothetical protein K439DRAFT_1620599 [Ramaria rubella]|nr:hypothetical protein K439DRAFT_1620599 [Ramaria rubella]